MKFKIVNVKCDNTGASIRVDVGIVSFNVRVYRNGDKYQVDKPAGIFFPDVKDYNDLIGAVIGEYIKNVSGNNAENVSNGIQEKIT